METRRFGKAERETSVIGQGTWYIDRGDRSDAVAALRRGLDCGMSHIDTAEMYGDAELVIGEAIADRRDEAFLVSKVLPANASASGAVEACERSLRRLGTDRLDCYLLHWRGQHPLEETFTAFDRLQRDGKILAFGVSNFDVRDLEEAWTIAEGRIACNQVLYHLEERAIEHDVIPWCEKNGVAVAAYSPFGHDRFPTQDSAGGRVLAEIGKSRSATARQVALAFLTRNSSLLAIPKASSAEHVEENAGSAKIHLNEEEIGRIDAAFPRGAKPRTLPIL